jgi:hypothetical protein
MPKLKRLRPHRTLTGTGPVEDFFNDAGQKIKNEFTNPDSLTAQAFKSAENALGSVFDPNKNGLREKLGAAIDSFKKFTEQLPADLKAGLDPNQNGVAEAFRKFGQDTNGAFEEIGRRILARAGVDKAALDFAFGPIRDELLRVDSEIGKFMLRQLGTQEDWKKKFEDPDTYFTIAGILLTAAAAVVAAPAASTAAMGFFAVNLGLACAQVLMHAAQGKPFSIGDGITLGFAIFGPAIGRMGTAAYQAAYKSVFKTAASTAAPGMLSALGQAAAIPIAQNQLMFNVRGMGQTFTAVSTANMETGGASPVDLPNPPAAPPPLQGNLGLSGGPDQGLNRPEWMGASVAQGEKEETEQTRQATEDQAREDLRSGKITMEQYSNIVYGNLQGSGKGRSRLVAHAQMHRRGRRKSHDSIDSAHFC